MQEVATVQAHHVGKAEAKVTNFGTLLYIELSGQPHALADLRR
jgi:hypothetical protein